MSRNAKIALVVVGCLSLMCVLLCAAALLVGGRAAGQVFSTDPEQAREVGRQIADYTAPPGYAERMSMNVLASKWVMIGPAAGHSGLIFMLMQASGMRREQMEAQMRQSLQAQLGTGGDPQTLVETRNVLIKGKPVALSIYEGSARGGNRLRQAFAGFDGKSGATLLMVTGVMDEWDDAVVEQFIASIK
ncbi:MAG: hypothetical protein HZB53_13415 [Chloroflexi bacterium]|nr:hypothetical protein [Chloroflexota bacterium]